jgi:hypothetical protein
MHDSKLQNVSLPSHLLQDQKVDGFYSGQDVCCFDTLYADGHFTEANTKVILQQELPALHIFFF